MPVYDVDAKGRQFEVDAPDMQAATATIAKLSDAQLMGLLNNRPSVSRLSDTELVSALRNSQPNAGQLPPGYVLDKPAQQGSVTDVQGNPWEMNWQKPPPGFVVDKPPWEQNWEAFPAVKSQPVTADALVRQAVRGIPIVGPYGNKFAAGMDALTQPVLGRGSNAPTLAERYAANLPAEEAKDVGFEQANPVAATAAQIGGGLAATAPLAATAVGARALGIAGPNLAARMGAGAVSGATINALDAAARGGSPNEAAVPGFLIGGALPGASRVIGAATSGLRNAARAAPTTPLNTVRVGGVDLPLTGGEAARDFTQVMDEQAALRGGKGPKAQQVAQGFYEPRTAAIDQATQNIKGGYSPSGAVVAETPQEAGDVVSSGLINARNAAKADVNKAYDVVKANTDVIPSDEFTHVGNRIRADLSTAQEPVIVSDKTTPAASQMLEHLDQWGGIPRNKADIPIGNGPIGSTMTEIDQFRKELLSIKAGASNDADRRASGRVLGAFDRQIDQIAPSPELAAARAAHADYRQTFFQRGTGDDAGRILERIVGNRNQPPATSNEVGSWLYGSPKGTSVRVAQRLGDIFGTSSPEWSAVKQGLLSHVVEAPAGMQTWGPQKVSQRLGDFLTGRGSDLAKATFSNAERKELSALANYLQRTVPPAGAVNYSNTAPVLKRILGYLPRALLSIAGATVGGIPGYAAGHLAGSATKSIGESLAARSTARSLYGKPVPQNLSPQQLKYLQQLNPALAAQVNR